MGPQFYFWIIFATLSYGVIHCSRKYCMLKDNSAAKPRPYSWARVQLAWWTVIVLSCFITILIRCEDAPTFNTSTLILIGISAATITTAKVIDVSDEEDPNIQRHQDAEGRNFVLDILSDENGASIHRFQTIIFNIIFGIYFIVYVLSNLGETPGPDKLNDIMPVISNNNLVLLGLSSATYAAMKITENKRVKPNPNTANLTEASADTAAELETEPAVG